MPYRVSILKAHFNLSYHNFERFYCPCFYDKIRSSQEVGKSVKGRYMTIFKTDYFQDTFKASSIQDMYIYIKAFHLLSDKFYLCYNFDLGYNLFYLYLSVYKSDLDFQCTTSFFKYMRQNDSILLQSSIVIDIPVKFERFVNECSGYRKSTVVTSNIWTK